MLKQRVLTAVVLASVLLWAIFAWPAPAFNVLLCLIGFLAAREWIQLSFGSDTLSWGGSAGFTAVLAWALFSLDHSIWTQNIAFVATALWLTMSVWLFASQHEQETAQHLRIGRLLLGALVIFSTVICLSWLRDSAAGSPVLLLYAFCIVWAADIGAYFAGRRFGQHKLAPGISPGKTWEGAVGGMLAVLVLFVIGFLFLDALHGNALALCLATLVAGVYSVIGDLMESALKRRAGVKDSGTLLPGHGGVLDRIDSILAAAPIFVALLIALSE